MSTLCLAVTQNRATRCWHHWIQFHEQVLKPVSAAGVIIYRLSCAGERLRLPSLVEDSFSNSMDPYTLWMYPH